MNVSLILAPYYLGHRDRGMGAGPTAFHRGGAEQALSDAGHDVCTRVVEYPGDIDHEVGGFFAVCRLIAEAVREAASDGRFPLVLAGNCGTAVGTLAGIGADHLGIVWLDAHGDFHTPSTTGSGFFDGMPLTLVTGQCWETMLDSVDGFAPVPESRVLLAGVRELDPGERERVAESELITADYDALRSRGVTSSLVPSLELLASRASALYLHVDLDVLHNRLVPASEYSPPGGLTPDQLRQVLDLVDGRFKVRAASLNCYNPAGDPKKRALRAGLDVLTQLVALA